MILQNSMKKIILFDKNPNFIQNIQLELMMNEESYDVKIESTVTDTSDIITILNAYKPDELVVCGNIIDNQPDWNFNGVQIRAYATSPEEVKIIEKYGVKSFGMFNVKETDRLLHAIDKDILTGGNPMMQPQTQPQTVGQPAITPNYNNAYPQTGNNVANLYQQNSPIGSIPRASYPTQQMPETPMNMQEPMGQMSQTEAFPYNQMATGIPGQQAIDPYTAKSQTTSQQMQNPMMGIPTSSRYPNMTTMNGEIPNQSTHPAMNTENPDSYPQARPYSASLQMPAYPGQAPGYPTAPQATSAMQILNQSQAQVYNAQYEAAVMRDLNYHDAKKTEIITVFSAKGGTGKSTISSSIALALSQAAHKKNFYKVALVDFDISFGTISTILGLNSDPMKNITTWGKVIRNKVETQLARMNITNPDNLNDEISRIANALTFSKEEIDDYMIKYEDTGLSILAAPLTHQDSYEFDGYEYDTILHSLAACGEYDYIVIDTGNNTDNASSSALDYADKVYIVFTQDMATITCNETFYNSMKAMRLDTNKFKYIINRARNDTALAESDIAKVVPYKQVCCIKDSPAVTKSNNQANPLVFDTKSDFSQNIQYILEDITGVKNDEPKKKKGLFGVFKKK